jgi:hypothetical protein
MHGSCKMSSKVLLPKMDYMTTPVLLFIRPREQIQVVLNSLKVSVFYTNKCTHKKPLFCSFINVDLGYKSILIKLQMSGFLCVHLLV